MPEKAKGTREQEALENAYRYLPGGSNGNLYMDIVIERGLGSRVWDLSGNEYVDYLLGSGPMLLGHAHPEVVAAVTEQVRHGTTFYALNEYAIRLAEEIVQAVSCAEKVRFVSSGTEATAYAMKAVRAYRKRDKILKFEGGFHGMNDYALMSVAPVRPPEFPYTTSDSAGIPRSVQSEMLIAPFNDIDITSSIIERHSEELAGVIVEPFQRVISPKPGFLQGLREVTQLHQVPLIFDEIVTGFRFAYGGAQEYYGVTPDLCTVGKVMGGGFPLAAVAGRQEIMDHFDPARVRKEDYILQIGTLSGNPIAAVAGLATLRVLRREGTYERLFATGQRIKDAAQRLFNEAAVPAQVVGVAPLFDVYFTEEEIIDYRSTLSSDKQKSECFTRLLRERGVLKGEQKYYVSTAHDNDDVDLTIDAFTSAIEELAG